MNHSKEELEAERKGDYYEALRIYKKNFERKIKAMVKDKAIKEKKKQ